MKRAVLKDAGAGMQFLFTALIVIGCWLVFQLLSLFSGMLIYGIGFEATLEVLQSPQSPVAIAFLKYIQAVTSIGMFIVASLIAAWFFSEDPMDYLKLNMHPGALVSLMTGLLIVFTLPMNNYLTFINNELQLPEGIYWLQEYFERKEGEMQEIMTRFLSVSGSVPLLVNLIVIALIPSIGEELLFRGIIQRLTIRAFGNIHLGIIAAAFLFGVLHFQFLSLLPRFVLGILLGYLFIWTSSLWMPILAHFINNGLAVIFYQMYYSGRAGDQLEQIGTPGNMPFYAFVSFSIVLALLLVIRRMVKERPSS